jgi:hypothetical protein
MNSKKAKEVYRFFKEKVLSLEGQGGEYEKFAH